MGKLTTSKSINIKCSLFVTVVNKIKLFIKWKIKYLALKSTVLKCIPLLTIQTIICLCWLIKGYCKQIHILFRTYNRPLCKKNEGGLRGVRQPMGVDYLSMTEVGCVGVVVVLGEGCSSYRSFWGKSSTLR